MQRVSKCFLASLTRHDILPAGSVDWSAPVAAGTAGDLLPLLIARWRSAYEQCGRAGQRQRMRRLLAWLEREQHEGGALTRGVPGTRRRVQDWVGERLVWWPRGVPAGERVAIVSSRLGRLDQFDHHWFAALRQVCAELDAGRQVLVSAQGTALAELLERCSQLHEVPGLQFELARPGLSPARWLAECVTRELPPLPTVDRRWPAIVSPTLSARCDQQIPARDSLVVAASDRVIACRVRRGGNISRLLDRRLAETPPRTRSHVVIMIGDGFVSPGVARGFVGQGATPREVTSRTVVPPAPVHERRSGRPCMEHAQIIALEDLKLADYLSHCTRRADGPWPDQDREGYLDSLLLGHRDVTRSALATLARIVGQRRLLATGRTIRGGTPVVCFTAVEIAALRQLRTFRVHRTRWDFEPYGIGIAKDWLMDRGTRPVRYGDETLWKQLAETQRPFFQPRCSGRGSAIDWSVEREWRHVGTVELADLPPDAAFVFVPSRDEAEQISRLSHWPVVDLSS